MLVKYQLVQIFENTLLFSHLSYSLDNFASQMPKYTMKRRLYNIVNLIT